MLKVWTAIGVITFFGVVLWVAAVHGLITGEVTIRRHCSKRTEEPLGYWLITLLRIAFATLCTCLLIFVLMKGYGK